MSEKFDLIRLPNGRTGVIDQHGNMIDPEAELSLKVEAIEAGDIKPVIPKLTFEIALTIVEKIAETNDTLQEIAQGLKIPYVYIISWKRRNEVFRDMIEEAYKARAEEAVNMAHKTILEIDELEESKDNHNYKIRKTKAEGLIALAEKLDKKKYGNDKDIGGSGNGASITIITGIEPPKPITVINNERE